MSHNLRNAKGLFAPVRLFLSSLRFGLLMPIACGRRLLVEEYDEDYSSHIHWINSKIKDSAFHIRHLSDLAEGTSLLKLVDSCLQSSAVRNSRHGFAFGDMEDRYSLSLVKVRVALNIMETKGVIRKGEFSAELIASCDVDHIRAVVVKLALFPTTLQREKRNRPEQTKKDVIQNSVVTEVW